ncbi:ADP-ribose pyrophosphatase [Lacticaseibacillus casei A2-362]|nr:ADP-ribose pyrophosphatase [Lacticaseibacillus casei A2-362]
MAEADPKETLALQYFDFDQLPPLFNQQSRDMISFVQAYLQTQQAH